MALGRRLLRLLLVAAVAFAPLGAAAHAQAAPASATQQTHKAHHRHHGPMSGMEAVMPEAAQAASPCHGDKTDHHSNRGCCCDDKASCGSSCLQKCFGQAAVMPPVRSQRLHIVQRFLLRPVDRPPDWRASPHPPPPRA